MKSLKLRAIATDKDIGMFDCYFIDLEKNRGLHANGEWYYVERFLLFIGITDKNGKEIYEEDIMKLENLPKGVPIYYKVIFEDGKFICAGMDIHYVLDFCNGKVVGNNYENPGLLEE